MVGIPIGRYWQISTNLHLYVEHLDMLLNRIKGYPNPNLWVTLKDEQDYGATQPLVTYPEAFDNELMETVDWIDRLHNDEEIYTGNISNGFLREVVLPMALAHWMYKKKDFNGALAAIEAVIAEDWRKAGIEWIKRRMS